MRAESDLFGPLPLARLSIVGQVEAQNSHDEDEDVVDVVDDEDQDAPERDYDNLNDMLDVIWTLGQSETLKVLFLQSFDFSPEGAVDFLATVLEQSPAMSTLRLDRCDGFPEGLISIVPTQFNTAILRTIQIMHGSPSLVTLVTLAPRPESLVFWPTSERLGSLASYIADHMSQLRFLSLGVAQDADVSKLVADALECMHARDEPIPLEELVLAGPRIAEARGVLIAALRHANIKRVALCNLNQVTSALVAEIVRNAPQLEGLTLVQGDASAPVKWPAPLAEYTHQLGKLQKLSFFAWDRFDDVRAPIRSMYSRVRNEPREDKDGVFAQLGAACTTLREAFSIREAEPEGTLGWVAKFKRDEERLWIKVTYTRIQDFLVQFERWCVVPQ